MNRRVKAIDPFLETRKSAQICANNSLKTTFSFSLNHPHLFNHSTATVQPSGSNSRCSTLSRTFRQTLGCCLQLAMAKWRSCSGTGSRHEDLARQTQTAEPGPCWGSPKPRWCSKLLREKNSNTKHPPENGDFYVISMGLSQTLKPQNAWLWFSLWELPFRGIPQFETTFRWQFLTWRLFNFLMMSFFTTCCGSLALAQECALQEFDDVHPNLAQSHRESSAMVSIALSFLQNSGSHGDQLLHSNSREFWYLWTWLNPSWKTFPIQTHSKQRLCGTRCGQTSALYLYCMSITNPSLRIEPICPGSDLSIVLSQPSTWIHGEANVGPRLETLCQIGW